MPVRLIAILGVKVPSVYAPEGRHFCCPQNSKGEGLEYKRLNPSLADPVATSGSWLNLGRARI